MLKHLVSGSLSIFVLLLAHSAAPRAQNSSEGVVRTWSCLTSSAARESIFGGGIPANAACAGAGHPWQPLSGRFRALDAIAVPGAPTGLVATVSGTTVVLTWAASPGGTPSSYI